MLYFCVFIILWMTVRQKISGDILCRMNHLSVSDGFKNNVGNILRDGTKQVRAGHNDLLPHADHHICVDRQVTAFPF